MGLSFDVVCFGLYKIIKQKRAIQFLYKFWDFKDDSFQMKKTEQYPKTPGQEDWTLLETDTK